LAQPRRSGQQDVVGSRPAPGRPGQHEAQLLDDLGLADELVQGARPQAGLGIALPAEGARGEEVVGVGPGHRPVPSIDSAVRSRVAASASGASAAAASVAFSAAFSAKPSPTRPATTCTRTPSAAGAAAVPAAAGA